MACALWCARLCRVESVREEYARDLTVLAHDHWNDSDITERLDTILEGFAIQLGVYKPKDVADWTYFGSVFYCGTHVL